mmetsp:Transcript_11384/g.21601  ORF Transcript_11384/g.21601 Transcript_11384/m.21601 type:complete len:127 (-) Transcript_11384:301-681(-)
MLPPPARSTGVPSLRRNLEEDADAGRLDRAVGTLLESLLPLPSLVLPEGSARQFFVTLGDASRILARLLEAALGCPEMFAAERLVGRALDGRGRDPVPIPRLDDAVLKENEDVEEADDGAADPGRT